MLQKEGGERDRQGKKLNEKDLKNERIGVGHEKVIKTRREITNCGRS